MAKGTKTTKTERKEGRGEFEEVESSEDMIPVPKKLLKALEDAVAQSKPLAKVRWGMAQLVNLQRLDPGRKFENIRFNCEIELPVPAKPEKIADAVGIIQEMVEDEIATKIDELEAALENE